MHRILYHGGSRRCGAALLFPCAVIFHVGDAHGHPLTVRLDNILHSCSGYHRKIVEHLLRYPFLLLELARHPPHVFCPSAAQPAGGWGAGGLGGMMKNNQDDLLTFNQVQALKLTKVGSLTTHNNEP